MSPTNTISDDEFASRRAKAVAAAKEDGLDALLVCSRGGGTLDRYANVAYLTSFYTPFPYIPDQAPEWTARAHTFLILPVSDPPHLIADVPYLDEVSLGADEITRADDVTGTLISAMRRLGLSKATVGVVGDDVIPWKTARVLEERLPDVAWKQSDRILDTLRAIKSPAEISLLRDAARLGSRALDAMMDVAGPGVSHGEVAATGQAVLCGAGALLYNAFMASGTGGPDASVVRCNCPTWGATTPLAEGQWFRLGISGVFRGYYFDVSRSKAIGRPRAEQMEAFEAAIACVEASRAVLRPGVAADEVARAGLDKQRQLGFPVEGVFSGMGHGIGLGWDTPWLVRGETMPLRAHMVLNLERTLARNGFLGDFEETYLLGEEGVEVLTDARLRNW